MNGFAVASVVDMRISGEHISERINERKLLLLYKQPACLYIIAKDSESFDNKELSF